MEFNLSEKVSKAHPTIIGGEIIDARDVKEFIRLLKEDILDGDDINSSVNIKWLLNNIDKLAGDKLT